MSTSDGHIHTMRTVAFRDSFKGRDDVQRYEHEVYEPEGFDAFIWNLQRPLVIDRVARQVAAGSGRYLDFACGTGRIALAVEMLTDSSVAIDTSSEMVEVARPLARKTRFVVGDLLHDASLVEGPFDIITAFRFFLNLEAPLRLTAMRTLAGLLTPDGCLIFNVHGNQHSARHFGVERRRRRGEAHNEMTEAEIRELVAAAGLRIESMIGFGLFPRRLHSTPLRTGVRLIERWSAERQLGRRWSQDLLFVCRRG
jgi:SAM-dependent methyltransferase